MYNKTLMDWKDILGYEGLYQISSNGDVKSIKKNLILSPGTTGGNKKGGEYKCVNLSNGKAKLHYIHRLVAIAFVPNPDNLPEVDHINQNKLDNRMPNLRWIAKNNNHLNKQHKLGTSGHHNITHDKRHDTYVVRFTRRPKCIYIGSFKNIKDALIARDDYLSTI